MPKDGKISWAANLNIGVHSQQVNQLSVYGSVVNLANFRIIIFPCPP